MHKMVRLEWFDHSSHSESRWRTLDETEELSSVSCVSVGWLVKETKYYFIIAQTCTADGMYLNDMMILKGCVKNKRILFTK